jgi:hypothetical protein
LWLHYFEHSALLVFVSAGVLALVLSFWFKDLIIEGQYTGVFMLQNNEERYPRPITFMAPRVTLFFRTC